MISSPTGVHPQPQPLSLSAFIVNHRHEKQCERNPTFNAYEGWSFLPHRVTSCFVHLCLLKDATLFCCSWKDLQSKQVDDKLNELSCRVVQQPQCVHVYSKLFVHRLLGQYLNNGGVMSSPWNESKDEKKLSVFVCNLLSKFVLLFWANIQGVHLKLCPAMGLCHVSQTIPESCWRLEKNSTIVNH